MKYQTITRKGSFDAAHRVMNEKVKCWNLHGHRFDYELTFEFKEEEGLGYALDFKEIKRVACQFIDDKFDHGCILNPEDEIVLRACNELGCKVWLMSLAGGNYCNPSAEHISKELFMAISRLMNTSNIWLKSLKLYETPNCWVEVDWDAINIIEQKNFDEAHQRELDIYKVEKGEFEYDDRKPEKDENK